MRLSSVVIWTRELPSSVILSFTSQSLPSPRMFLSRTITRRLFLPPFPANIIAQWAVSFFVPFFVIILSAASFSWFYCLLVFSLPSFSMLVLKTPIYFIQTKSRPPILKLTVVRAIYCCRARRNVPEWFKTPSLPSQVRVSFTSIPCFYSLYFYLGCVAFLLYSLFSGSGPDFLRFLSL